MKEVSEQDVKLVEGLPGVLLLRSVWVGGGGGFPWISWFATLSLRNLFLWLWWNRRGLRSDCQFLGQNWNGSFLWLRVTTAIKILVSFGSVLPGLLSVHQDLAQEEHGSSTQYHESNDDCHDNDDNSTVLHDQVMNSESESRMKLSVRIKQNSLFQERFFCLSSLLFFSFLLALKLLYWTDLIFTFSLLEILKIIKNCVYSLIKYESEWFWWDRLVSLH